jgi:hypothetical protein
MQTETDSPPEPYETATAKRARQNTPRKPSYDVVFRLPTEEDADASGGFHARVWRGIDAPTRDEAIDKVRADLPEDEAFGDWAASLVGDLKWTVRADPPLVDAMVEQFRSLMPDADEAELRTAARAAIKATEGTA